MDPFSTSPGQFCYDLASRLFPLNRSITGNAVRESFHIIQQTLPKLKIIEFPCTSNAGDWTIPPEWNLNSFSLTCLATGKMILSSSFSSNLHIASYSESVDIILSKQDLLRLVHTSSKHRDWIPYKTNYYDRKWQLCMSHNQLNSLAEGNYRLFIDADFDPNGSLSSAFYYKKGLTDRIVFISSYSCHPSMANNECSGPSLWTALAKYIESIQDPVYSYLFVLAPETIGPLFIQKYFSDTFLSKKPDFAFNLTCVGDNNSLSYMPSRMGNTPTDVLSLRVLNEYHYTPYSFLSRGSDERQYCSPQLDYPMVSIMRTKYNEYHEYHTSGDDMDFVSPEGFDLSYKIHKKIFREIELCPRYQATFIGEPMMRKYGLRAERSSDSIPSSTKDLMNVYFYCDGFSDSFRIAELTNLDPDTVNSYLKVLYTHSLVKL